MKLGALYGPVLLYMPLSQSDVQSWIHCRLLSVQIHPSWVVFWILNTTLLNSWYQRPRAGKREFNTSLVLTKHLSKSFLCHILLILLLQKLFLKIYFHKNCTLLIRSPRTLYRNHDDTFCIPIVTMLGEQYTLQGILICTCLYPFSYNILARMPIGCFSTLCTITPNFCLLF